MMILDPWNQFTKQTYSSRKGQEGDYIFDTGSVRYNWLKYIILL